MKYDENNINLKKNLKNKKIKIRWLTNNSFNFEMS